jgi:hypothetical protein
MARSITASAAGVTVPDSAIVRKAPCPTAASKPASPHIVCPFFSVYVMANVDQNCAGAASGLPSR